MVSQNDIGITGMKTLSYIECIKTWHSIVKFIVSAYIFCNQIILVSKNIPCLFLSFSNLTEDVHDGLSIHRRLLLFNQLFEEKALCVRGIYSLGRVM